MTANQSPTIEERLSRLETLFVNVGEKVAEHDETIKQHDETIAQHDGNIDVLVANIQELKETVQNLTEQTTRNINRLAEEAAQDRKIAALDRQEFRNQMEQRQREIQQIWQYLQNRNGGSSPPQQ